jgi:hypothetical protein
MAAAAHVTAGVYGTIAGQPPYTGDDQFTNFNVWENPAQMSFPTTGTVFHQVNPGVRVGNTSNYIYAVIEVQPTGLTNPLQSQKYATNVSVATLATNAG